MATGLDNIVKPEEMRWDFSGISKGIRDRLKLGFLDYENFSLELPELWEQAKKRAAEDLARKDQSTT